MNKAETIITVIQMTIYILPMSQGTSKKTGSDSAKKSNSIAVSILLLMTEVDCDLLQSNV